MILFPHSATSSKLAEGLLKEGHDLILYLPTDIHKKLSYTLPTDLQIAAKDFRNSVNVVSDLNQLSEVDVLVIPSLDVLPEKPRDEFAAMFNGTFK